MLRHRRYRLFVAASMLFSLAATHALAATTSVREVDGSVEVWAGGVKLASFPSSLKSQALEMARFLSDLVLKGFRLRDLRVGSFGGKFGIFYRERPLVVFDRELLRWHGASAEGLAAEWMRNIHMAMAQSLVLEDPKGKLSLGRIPFEQDGLASYYGGVRWNGRRTSSGEIFDDRQLVAASLVYPFNSVLLVTNLRNGRSVVVRIIDRGPYVRGRVIDLSTAAARALGMLRSGVVPVRIQLLSVGDKVAGFGGNAGQVRP